MLLPRLPEFHWRKRELFTPSLSRGLKIKEEGIQRGESKPKKTAVPDRDSRQKARAEAPEVATDMNRQMAYQEA